MSLALAILLALALQDLAALAAWPALPKAWRARDPALTLAIARILGLTLFAAAAALLAGLGLSNPAEAAALPIIGLALAALLRPGPSRRQILSGALPGLLILLPALALYAAAFIHNARFHPFSERPMDFSFLTHLSLNPAWPPADPWLAGEALNYYHFGFWLWAMLGRLIPAEPEILFMSALIVTWARIAELTALTARHLGRGSWPAALIALAALMICGNLDGLRQTLLNPDQPLDWWHSSRVIPGTITEFPWFSLLHGDLHPYLLALPPSLAILGILALVWAEPRPNPLALLVLVPILAALWITHAWNFLVLAALMALMSLWRALAPDRAAAGPGWQERLEWPIACIGTLALAKLASLPLLGGFSQAGRGLGLVLPEHRSTAPDLALVLGTIGGLALLAALCRLLQHRSRRRDVTAATIAGMAGLTGLAALEVLPGALILLPALPALALAATRPLPRSPLVLPALMITAGLTIILATEIVYIDDYYSGDADRLNTVFKLGFVSLFLIGLGGAALAGLRLPAPPAQRFVQPKAQPLAQLTLWSALLPITAGLAYPIRSIPVRYGAVEPRMALSITDGAPYEALAEAGRWIRAQAAAEPPGRPLRILEGANGEHWAYTWYGFVTMVSGQQGYVVWPMHQAGWRPGDEQMFRRREAVEAFYRSAPEQREERARFLADAGIDIIVYGPMERQDWPEIEAVLEVEFPILYRNDHVTLFAAQPGRL